ncbi:MAG: hypothetical protein WBM62_19895 [Crocosphaera sp.]|jgi:uncharacterized membrane protein YfcA
MLTYVTSWPAIAMSLGIVGTVSLIGAIPHWLQGNVVVNNEEEE